MRREMIVSRLLRANQRVECGVARRRGRNANGAPKNVVLSGLCVVVLSFAGMLNAQSIAPAVPPTVSAFPPATPAAAAAADHPKGVTDEAPLTPLNVPSGRSSNSPSAMPPPEIGDHRTLDESFSGIVADQVTTIIGQNFYGYFVAAWRDRPLVSRYNISIHERPSARWGSLVWIEYAHRRLFETFLSPARSDIRQAGEQAAEITYRSLIRIDIERLLFHDDDLATDEM